MTHKIPPNEADIIRKLAEEEMTEYLSKFGKTWTYELPPKKIAHRNKK